MAHQADQQAGNLASAREDLAGELATQGRQVAQAKACAEEARRCAVDEAVDTTRCHLDQVTQRLAKTEIELRGVVSQAEFQLQSDLKAFHAKVGELSVTISRLRVDMAAEHELGREAISVAQQSAATAAHKADAAEALARAAERTAREELLRGAPAPADQCGVARVRDAVDSLASATAAMARRCGLLGGSSDNRPESIAVGYGTPHLGKQRFGLEDLLRWESEGSSLADRIDRSWLDRERLGEPATLLDAVGTKADAEMLRAMQISVRDLESRVSLLLRERAASPAERVATARLAGGEPLAGAFGAAGPRRPSQSSSLAVGAGQRHAPESLPGRMSQSMEQSNADGCPLDVAQDPSAHCNGPPFPPGRPPPPQVARPLRQRRLSSPGCPAIVVEVQA